MKKKFLFCLLICLIGMPLLLLACTPADVKTPDTSAATEAVNTPPEDTDAEDPATEAAETETQAVEPETDPVETDPVDTEPVETDPVDTEPAESESESVEVETVPPRVASRIPGSAKLLESIDYSDTANWISFPENPDKSVDLFFLYPTVYGVKNLVVADGAADIDNAEMWEGATNSLKTQASVFSESCNIYMPAYRQLSILCLTNVVDEPDIVEYYLSRDIYNALDYYFENHNEGKPFILAGHSQGSVWVAEILENYMKDHPEYLERMVASYVIGYSVTTDYLAANPHLKFAEAADDIGVIVSYNVEGPGNKNQTNSVVRGNPVAINPLTWTRDETYASAELNLGSLDNAYQPVVPGVADARVDTERGVVVCESVDPALYKTAFDMFFGSESYHYYDYALYYFNLQENVATRIAAYFATHP